MSINININYSPFLFLYDVHPHFNVNPTFKLADLAEAEDFFQIGYQIGEETIDTLCAVKIKMVKYFNIKHISLKNMDKVGLKLIKGVHNGYGLPNISALNVIKIGPFIIKRKIGKLTFKLNLPDYMKIHPIISYIHLKPATNNPFNRKLPPPAPILIDSEKGYLINRILRKEQYRQQGDKSRQIYYQVRWQGYGPENNNWIVADKLVDQIPQIIEDFECTIKPSHRGRFYEIKSRTSTLNSYSL